MSNPESLHMVATLLTTEGETVDILGFAADEQDARQRIEERVISKPGKVGWRKEWVGAEIVRVAMAETEPSRNIFSREF